MNVTYMPRPKFSFIFIHKRLLHCNVKIMAPKYAEAVQQMEQIMGPYLAWSTDYICISQGKIVGYQAA